MSEQVGWAIVGTGRHADTRMAPALRRASRGRLVAVFSRDLGRAHEFAARHGADAGYASYERLLDDPGVDVVYVSTPHALHHDFVLGAAKAGKHVLCEKPLALTVSDAREMLDACRVSGVRLGVCFQNRFHPAHVETRRLVAEGRVGQVQMARAQYSRHGLEPLSGWRADATIGGAGSLMGLGLHALDLVRYVSGEEFAEVTALMDSDPASGVLDEEVALLVRLGNGGFAFVNANRDMPWATNELAIEGYRARVRTSNTVGTMLRGSLEVETENASAKFEYSDPDPATALYAAMVDDFCDAVVDGREPRATGSDGLAMVRLTEAILRSVTESRTVRLQ